MNYSQAVDFLQVLTDYEKSPATAYSSTNYDLRRMLLLLDVLGNPHMGRKTIHVAGTKGKGSTVSMIASVLSSAGLNVGVFTSPHLFSWQERISINGHNTPQADFARLVSRIQPLVSEINRESRYGKLTTFETLTALAFCYFHEKCTHFQVLETGMGGRLDATNVIDDPEVCIITSISLDHTQVLGNTLDLIAGEKVGIIKRGCTLISAPQPPEVLAVIEQKSREMNVRLILAGRDITWQQGFSNLKRQTFTVKGTAGEYHISIPLLGDYQMENASLAIGAIEVLQQKGVPVNQTHIVRGLRRAKWPARMQLISEKPLIIIDGAHNSYSLNRAIESIRRNFTYEKVFIIFGSSQDKDIEDMAKVLCGFASEVIITSSSHPRAAKSDYIASVFDKCKMKHIIAGNIAESLTMALTKSTGHDLVLATGSLFIAADVYSRMAKSGIKKRCPRRTTD